MVISRVVMIPYMVHQEKRPFYMFGLRKEEMGLSFPAIKLEEAEYDRKDIIRLSGEYLKTELTSYRDVVVSYQSEDEIDGVLYLYYEVSMNCMNSYILSYSSIWFVTLHEIINTRSVCNIEVMEEVTEYLKSRVDYFEDVGVPSVYYDGGETKKMMFESVFGCSKVDGYYRFYGYKEACDKGFVEKTGAVVRYAVFVDEVGVGCEVSSYDDFVPLSVHPISVVSEYTLI